MKQLYMDVLRLDNFLQALTAQERTMIHQYHAGYRTSVPIVVLTIYEWIRENNWESPYLRYDQDRVLMWYNEYKKGWEPIETHELYRAKVER
ncbi:hypothetical protein [Capnocytophaga granulosa]|uniref:hypothetical protein n=1 Tax=Capnocytophaga granulosa TaxID=45242 RepID=UPI0028E3EBB6|nr:hypothetical protein [Capnocytophaga granulosa]